MAFGTRGPHRSRAVPCCCDYAGHWLGQVASCDDEGGVGGCLRIGEAALDCCDVSVARDDGLEGPATHGQSSSHGPVVAFSDNSNTRCSGVCDWVVTWCPPGLGSPERLRGWRAIQSSGSRPYRSDSRYGSCRRTSSLCPARTRRAPLLLRRPLARPGCELRLQSRRSELSFPSPCRRRTAASRPRTRPRCRPPCRTRPATALSLPSSTTQRVGFGCLRLGGHLVSSPSMA